MYYSHVESANWLITPTVSVASSPVLTNAPRASSASARVRPPVVGTDLSNQIWMVVLSGVAIIDGPNDEVGFPGTLPYDWRRDELYIPNNERPALDFAIDRYGIPRPDPSRYWPVLSLQPGGWAPFVVASSYLHAPHRDEYDEDLPNVPNAPTLGVAIDRWRPSPFSPMSDASGKPIPNVYAGLIADIAAYGAATLYRASYQVTLLGKIVFAGA